MSQDLNSYQVTWRGSVSDIRTLLTGVPQGHMFFIPSSCLCTACFLVLSSLPIAFLTTLMLMTPNSFPYFLVLTAHIYPPLPEPAGSSSITYTLCHQTDPHPKWEASVCTSSRQDGIFPRECTCLMYAPTLAPTFLCLGRPLSYACIGCIERRLHAITADGSVSIQSSGGKRLSSTHCTSKNKGSDYSIASTCPCDRKAVTN